MAGEKVYPRDVEEVLHRHPAVADAVVLGVPDADRGEVVKAYVALRAGHDCSAEALIDYLRPLLADFKVPRSVELVAYHPPERLGQGTPAAPAVTCSELLRVLPFPSLGDASPPPVTQIHDPP